MQPRAFSKFCGNFLEKMVIDIQELFVGGKKFYVLKTPRKFTSGLTQTGSSRNIDSPEKANSPKVNKNYLGRQITIIQVAKVVSRVVKSIQNFVL